MDKTVEKLGELEKYVGVRNLRAVEEERALLERIRAMRKELSDSHEKIMRRMDAFERYCLVR